METRFIKPPFFIAASPRSGFHFFMSLIESTGAVKGFGERLKSLGNREHTDENILSCFEDIAEDRGIDGSWGTKVEVDSLHLSIRYLHLNRMPLKSVKWIWLRRRNIIKQAISHLRAIETDIWHQPIRDVLSENDKVEVTSSTHDLIWNVAMFSGLNQCWQSFFEVNGIEPYTIFYEDFIDESTWPSLVEGVMDFLDIPYDRSGQIQSGYIKQSDDSETDKLEQLFIKYWFPFMEG